MKLIKLNSFSKRICWRLPHAPCMASTRMILSLTDRRPSCVLAVLLHMWAVKERQNTVIRISTTVFCFSRYKFEYPLWNLFTCYCAYGAVHLETTKLVQL